MVDRRATLLLTALLAGSSPAERARVHGPQEAPGIEAVAFLAGCWRGSTGNLEVREEWSDEVGGVMHYSTRFIREGAVVDWEFGRIVVEDGVVTLWPYPRGSRSEHGFPLVAIGTETVFENLEHDFPVRIIYRRDGADRLYPRIEGRDGSGREWLLERRPCP